MKMQLNEIKRMQQLANIIVEEIIPKNKDASKLQFILGDLCDFYGEETADDLISDEWKNYTVGQIIDDWKKLKGFIKEVDEENVDQSQESQPTDGNKEQDKKASINTPSALIKQLVNIQKMMSANKIKPSTAEIKAVSNILQTVFGNVNDKEIAQQINRLNQTAQKTINKI